MIESTVRNLLSPGTWRRLRDRLVSLEDAMAVTEGEIHDARISRLEADVALLRAYVGVPQDADTEAMSKTARAGIEVTDRLQRTS